MTQYFNDLIYANKTRTQKSKACRFSTYLHFNAIFLFDLSLSILPLLWWDVWCDYSMMSEEFDEFLFMTDDTAIKKLLSAIIILIRSHNYT